MSIAKARNAAARAARKFNFKTREYEPYTLPELASLFEDDTETIVACAECGKLAPFGGMMTSRRIHTAHGFGFMVCESCNRLEFAEERDAIPTHKDEADKVSKARVDACIRERKRDK